MVRPTAPRLGGGAQYPYPKQVWSPSGGWWTRPSNWASNTAIVGAGIVIATYGVWMWSAEHERRHSEPYNRIPSQMWAKEFKDGKLGVKDQSHLVSSSSHH